MDIFKEWDQAPVEVAEDRSVAVEYTGWDQSCQLPNRGHVDALLDISEDTSSKEQEPFEFLCLSGWEEAIQGWGRTTPLGCLVQTQRRGKRVKSGDTDHHRHLCVDLVKLSDPPYSESSLTHSPESFCDSSLDQWEKPPPTTLGDFLNRPYSHTSSVSSEESPPESFRDLQKATQQLTLRDKMVEDKAEVCEISDSLLGSAPSQGHHHSASECPMTLIINSFAVLPPVKASQPGHPRVTSQLRRGEAGPGRSASDGETAEAGSDGVTPAGESGSVERVEETRAADAVPDKDRLPKDTYQGSLTSKYWPSKQSHHLLSAFSIPVPKRCDMPLSTLAEPLARATYPLGRHLRQDPRTSSAHRLYFGRKTKSLKRAEPQLPILFGTRVPIPASAQRLL
ncbi:uncharacterized protein C16orf46 [Coregonus clupeaformis]|uniref:uncharacterized protein C16orf46 n=1 Tax=Coregonus clupeaformis TaxID=59861 RepID=UPI001BE0D679|nr:uncharacterized protein C16orf46 [Coregonus clupeaformis]